MAKLATGIEHRSGFLISIQINKVVDVFVRALLWSYGFLKAWLWHEL